MSQTKRYDVSENHSRPRIISYLFEQDTSCVRFCKHCMNFKKHLPVDNSGTKQNQYTKTSSRHIGPSQLTFSAFMPCFVATDLLLEAHLVIMA